MTVFVVIDNYDSFTYNLVQQLGERGQKVLVQKNDAVSVGALSSGAYRGELRGLVISPGPGRPEDAGVSVEIVKQLSGLVPILGVCLGHQCIASALGGTVKKAGLMHGKTSRIYHNGQKLFAGIPSPFEATRYHSLTVCRSSLPGQLEISAETEEQAIMAIFHREDPTFGLQFHPESILTPRGGRIIDNFIEVTKRTSIKGAESR